MNPTAIAALTSAAVSLLTQYFKSAGEEFSKTAGKAAWSAAARVFRLVRSKVGRSAHGKAIFDRLQQAPDDLSAQRAARSELHALIEEDSEFGSGLAESLKRAADAGADRLFSTTIHGGVRKLIQIGEVHGIVKL